MQRVISDEDYNAQGTFYFPAGFRNETQYIAFWDAVAIPDKALGKLLSDQEPLERTLARRALASSRASARKYRELLREQEVDGSDFSDVRRKVRAELDLKIRGILPEIEASIRESEEKLARRKSGDPDEFLTQVLARPVARATGLATYLPAELDVITRDRILDHEFELGDGRWMNARVIVDRFKTLELDFLRAR